IIHKFALIFVNNATGKTDRDDIYGNGKNYLVCMEALWAIADRDPAVNQLVIGSLSFVGQGGFLIRASAMKYARKSASVKQALKALLALATNDRSAQNRITAIEILTDIADAESTPTIRKTLEKMRFDADQSVRAAVEKALDQLKDK